MIYHHTKFRYKNICSSVDASKSPVLIRQTLTLTIANQPSCMTLWLTTMHHHTKGWTRRYRPDKTQAWVMTLLKLPFIIIIYYYHHYYKFFQFTPAPLRNWPGITATCCGCGVVAICGWGGGSPGCPWGWPDSRVGWPGATPGWAWPTGGGLGHTRLTRWGGPCCRQRTHTHVWQHAKTLANHPAIDKTVVQVISYIWNSQPDKGVWRNQLEIVCSDAQQDLYVWRAYHPPNCIYFLNGDDTKTISICEAQKGLSDWPKHV